MKLVRTRVAFSVASAVLAVGLTVSTAGAAADDTTTTRPRSSNTTRAQCAQLRQRLAGAPATLRRVHANLDELRGRLDEVRRPSRRAMLEQRIQRLDQLRDALAQRVADARAACSTTT